MFVAAFGLGWSPCIGPVLASVLTFAASNAESPWQGAAYLGVYAAGLSLPLLVLAGAASRALAWLKRSRTAIPFLEKLTGGGLLALGAWTMISLGWSVTSEPARVHEERAVVAPQAAASCASEGASAEGCALPAVRSVSAQVDAPVQGSHILEFTSHDCPVCRRMRPVLDKLTAACTELQARIVRVDVTTANGRALADRHGVRGTPTFVLFDDAGNETTRLLGERTREDVAAAVEQTFGLSCWG